MSVVTSVVSSVVLQQFVQVFQPSGLLFIDMYLYINTDY